MTPEDIARGGHEPPPEPPHGPSGRGFVLVIVVALLSLALGGGLALLGE